MTAGLWGDRAMLRGFSSPGIAEADKTYRLCCIGGGSLLKDQPSKREGAVA